MGFYSTLAVNGGGWLSPRPGSFTPGYDPVPTVYEAVWAPRLVWIGVENLGPRPTVIRSPNCAACSESLIDACTFHILGKNRNVNCNENRVVNASP
jgi:hypothetical protein